MSQKQQEFKIPQQETSPLQGLGDDMAAIMQKKTVVAPAQTQSQPSKQKRIVKLRRVIGCGCGDGLYLNFTREVDHDDPLQDGDVVKTNIKGDKPFS